LKPVCVFDLGGVLLDWQPAAIVAELFEPEQRELLLQQVFRHPDWQRLDRGSVSRVDAITAAGARTGLERRHLARLFEYVPSALRPKPEAIALLEQVCRNGHEAYCLSNMPLHAIEYIERQHPFWGWFAGSVVSSRCGMLKPEPAIFRHLLSKFDLAPEQTFFIDDTPANVVAAEGLGMHGAVYRDTGECREALQEAGYLSS
jgi:putative hydrolase of the HAD superfamily